MKRLSLLVSTMILAFSDLLGQHSVARQWNEVLLTAIRNDFARPTVHARNLFHISAAMYDAWAVFDPSASPYFLGNDVGGYYTPFQGFEYAIEKRQELQREAISYAAYNLLIHRFQYSPGFLTSKPVMDSLLIALGYDPSFRDTDYSNGSAAALGVYIANQIKNYGLLDGSNEVAGYTNVYYQPVNEPLNVDAYDLADLYDPNCWQPLSFKETFIDQSGHAVKPGVVNFLSPEWGNVKSFSLTDDAKTVYTKGQSRYIVHHDPGAPAWIDTVSGASLNDPYKWGFVLTALWSGHLDNKDGVIWDISPAGTGNVNLDLLPQEFASYNNFYKLINGGDTGKGYHVNPKTGKPYTPQLVPRGDYTRVLAEFWADGPRSETPPGHWFSILNYVSDHPQFEKKFSGQGDIMNPLEWDIKSYFMLGGAMHDVAITIWGIKGYYDYIRPISAIRFMAAKGQSSDPNLPRYNRAGLPLIEGHIELVGEGDPLAGVSDQNLNQIKIRAWRGHGYLIGSGAKEAGAGWILAKEWWPFQRRTFVTPPFAGYLSGHSSFSRAAATVLTLLTGEEYFPGGLGEFVAQKDDYLVFEDGPGVEVKLQWAKYSDAADQCSLSRIWGGIHSPIDDLRGRKIGATIGRSAFEKANTYFHSDNISNSLNGFPNPTDGTITITGNSLNAEYLRVIDALGKEWHAGPYVQAMSVHGVVLDFNGLKPGLYYLKNGAQSFRFILKN